MPAQPMHVYVLGIIMNIKIIITLMAACLMQACTKNESTENASSNSDPRQYRGQPIPLNS